MPGIAQAQEPAETAAEREYAIGPGALSDVLAEFSAMAGVQLVFEPQMLAGLQSPGLQGRHSVQEGFSQLLQGSGYRLVSEGDGAYSLREVPAGTMTLPPVQISGTPLGAITEGTGSYTTGSSSTATRLPLSIRETPRSVSVMTRQRMDDQGITQLMELAQETPGLTVNQTGAMGADATPIYSRGFIVENYQIDGIRRDNSSYRSLVQTNDMAVYDRVEIVRGATCLMNVIVTPAATINLIRKHPSDQTEFSLTTPAGSWGYYRVEFDAGSPLNDSGTVRGRVVTAYQENDSYVDRLHERKKVFYGVLDIDLTAKTLVSVGVDIQEHGAYGNARTGYRPFFSDGSPANWSPSDSNAANWASSDRNNQSYFTSLEHYFVNGWLIKATLDHTTLDHEEMWGWVNNEVNSDTGQVTLNNRLGKG
ncbi:MAG: TonB-dependent siderophore receptor, partial [Parahaliea sp.]